MLATFVFREGNFESVTNVRPGCTIHVGSGVEQVDHLLDHSTHSSIYTPTINEFFIAAANTAEILATHTTSALAYTLQTISRYGLVLGRQPTANSTRCATSYTREQQCITTTILSNARTQFLLYTLSTAAERLLLPILLPRAITKPPSPQLRHCIHTLISPTTTIITTTHSTLHPLKIQPLKLHTRQPSELSPIHTNLLLTTRPRNLLNPARLRRRKLGIPIPPTDVQRNATQRLQLNPNRRRRSDGRSAQLPKRRRLVRDRRVGITLPQRTLGWLDELQSWRSPHPTDSGDEGSECSSTREDGVSAAAAIRGRGAKVVAVSGETAGADAESADIAGIGKDVSGEFWE